MFSNKAKKKEKRNVELTLFQERREHLQQKLPRSFGVNGAQPERSPIDLAQSRAQEVGGVGGGGEVDDKAIKRFAKYVTSFPVMHISDENRAEYLQKQMNNFKNKKNAKAVQLVIALSGVKVCQVANEKVVLMAHALKRISYSTCEPDNNQFAFLARNPKGPVGLQYCHVFSTDERYQAEELNAVLGKAFKVAYATITTKKEFFELVDGLNKEEQAFYEKVKERMRINTATKPEDLLKDQPLLAPDAVRGFGKEPEIQIKKPKKATTSKVPDNSSVFINLPDNVQLLTWGNDSEVSLFTDLDSASPDTFTEPQFTHSLPTNQVRDISSSSNQQSSSLPTYPCSGPDSEDVAPTAPPVEPCDLHQEMVSRQTNRVRPLPPAPYYEVDVKNEWSLYGSVASKSPLTVAPEAMNSGCHILLQDEQSPKNLGETDLQNGTPMKKSGKILLQDASAPPVFAYGESSDEMEDQCLSGEQNDAFTLDEDDVDHDEDYEELMRVARAFLHGSPVRYNRRSRDIYRDMLERECSLDDTLRYNRSESPQFGNEQTSYGSEPKCQRASKEQTSPKREHNPGVRGQIENLLSRSPDECEGSEQKTGSVGNLIGQFQNKSDQNGNFKPGFKTERESDKPNKEIKSLPKPAPRRRAPAPPPPRPPKNMPASTVNPPCGDKVEKVKGQVSNRTKPIPAPRTKFIKSDSISSSSSTTSSTTSSQGVRENQAIRSPISTNRKAVRAPGHIGHKVEVEVGKYREEKKTTIAPPRPPRRHPPSNITNHFAVELAKAPWFRTGIPKEIAVDILSQESIGAFMVRESNSHPGCFALSIRVQTTFNKSGLANYLIVKTKNGGYTIKGFGKDFEDLPRLIHHYSIHQDQLPCLLVMARSNPGFDTADDDTKPEDPEYMSLTDFRSLAEE